MESLEEYKQSFKGYTKDEILEYTYYEHRNNLIASGEESSDITLEEHYHCLICEKSYKTKKEADQCFKNHNELDSLRWVALESSYIKSYLYDLNHNIDYIIKKFKIEE